MKISLNEFRDMIAEAVRRTIAEAKKKPKLTAQRSEESIHAQRERQLRGLPGYTHGDKPLDLSKPLGKHSITKRQGASGIGNWTSEAKTVTDEQKAEGVRALVRMIVDEEIRVRRGR